MDFTEYDIENAKEYIFSHKSIYQVGSWQGNPDLPPLQVNLMNR